MRDLRERPPRSSKEQNRVKEKHILWGICSEVLRNAGFKALFPT
jgi:hypothetical protein